jgi:hypothetical protein
MLLGLRLPDRVDVMPQGTAAGGLGSTVPFAGAPFAEATAAAGSALSVNGLGGRQAEAAADTPNAAGQRRRRRGIPAIGPVVGEAMRANAAIRVFYGFMIFFLAFTLRSERFGKISDTVALAGLAVAIAAGGMIGTGIGSALKSRSPQAMMFTVLGLTAAAGTACAILFGLWSVWAVALAAAVAQTLVKVALDSILQREIPDEKRASTFAFSETLHQLALVAGGMLGLLLSLTGSGFAGLTVGAACLLAALCWLLIARRRRILRAHAAAASPAR